MYNNQNIIRENLESDLLMKFGEQVKSNVVSLIEKLKNKDTFIDNNLVINLQNVLHLEKQEVDYFIQLAEDIALASAFAPVLLFEKIPTLFFYGITHEVGAFLSNIKDYGARAVALFLGSDTLKTEDLIDVLEQSNISFYKILLNAVNNRHAEFGICCSFIMRFSAKIESVISIENINKYLDTCSAIIKKYGHKIAEQYIRNTHDFLAICPLESNLDAIDKWMSQSSAYAEFAITYPKIAFATLHSTHTSIITSTSTSDELKALKIKILKSEDYALALENSILFSDPNFSALLTNWPNLGSSIRRNVLFQLEKPNYKKYIAENTDTELERQQLNNVTHSNWLKSWMFCDTVIDLTYIRKKMGTLLQDKNNFSLESKSIVKQHSEIFDRANPDYNNERVLNMLRTLLTYCINDSAKHELSIMANFILGQCDALKDSLSQSNLVIQAWERDPWIDYGRSDELYSCTGIGDYNAANAPAFLADLNLNNLDIWSNGIKVGRIHLCLIKDAHNQSLLLLDCVDGTERIIASKKRFELVMKAVYEYAKWLGVYKIKVNFDIDYNTTPKKFIAHIEKTSVGQSGIEFYSRFLSVSTTRHLIPYPYQTFLESFIRNNGGFIRGTLISLEKNKD